MTVAVVTDSNTQLPPTLVERFGITVVPLCVTIDGMTYLEGVDLTADEFYARFEDGRQPPTVSTAQPSPGQFAAAYQAAAVAGATAILSVHIGSAVSGTVNSARLAAAASRIPVRIVDTGTASFAAGICAWAAAEALAGGATIDAAADIAQRAAAGVGNVFVVKALDLARSGGRLAAGAEQAAPARIPILTIVDGVMQVVGEAADLDEAVAVMVERVPDQPLRIGVGHGDRAMAPLADALEARLGDVVRYRVGPSVGAHTGPGTAGLMFAPVSPAGPR